MGYLRAVTRLTDPAAERSESAICTECLVFALAGCSLSVTADDRCQELPSACICVRHIHESSLSHRGVRTSEGVDVWPLRAMSIVVEASAADVPDNRPLSRDSRMYWLSAANICWLPGVGAPFG